MSRVLVTGASGFVGVPLLHALGAGDEIHALSRSAAPPVEAPVGVRWHRLDLADGAAVQTLIAELRPERLVHLAWYVEHGSFWNAPENVAWVERSLQLLRAFADAGGRRAVLVGTCAEYDWSRAQEPLAELESRLAPATLYGVAKDSLRRLAEAYARERELELAWGRLFFFYGPREHPARLVPSVTRALLAEQAAETTTGEQRRDFMHVDDVAAAIAALLDSDVTGPVNIASGQAVPVARIVELVGAAAGRPELVRAGSLASRPEPPLLQARVDRLRDEVGFRSRWSLRDGIEATVRWWADELGRRAR